MNRLAKWMMRLYPARWRRRYGDELDALLCETGGDAHVVADLLKGGLRMQFSTWSFPRLAAVLGLLGMLAGLAISFLTPVRYVASAELRLTGADSGVATMQMVSSMVTSRASLSNVINSPRIDLYREERKSAPLADVIEQMRRDIVFRPAGLDGFTILFTYRDQSRARAAAEALAENAAEQLRGLTKLALKYAGANAIEVIDPANLPVAPLRPDLLPMAFAGMAAGLLLACLWHIKSKRPGYVSFLIAGAAAGIAFGYLIPSIAGIFPDDFTLLRYESHATMYSERADAVPDLVMEAGSRSAIASLIATRPNGFYRRQFKGYTLDEFIALLQRDLAITTRRAGTNGRFIDISFTYSDRHKTQLIVDAVMNHITEHSHATLRATIPPTVRETQWGQIVPGSETRIDVETVSPNRASATIPGLLAGLALAAIIAMVRRRWVPAEEDEPAVPRNSGALKFNRPRFRKFAIWLASAGAACGTVGAVLAPARYVSDALLSFPNSSPDRMATLIDGVVNLNLDSTGGAMRDLSWQDVESGGARTNAFRIQFVADDPVRARSAVQDTLGDIDRAITNLHSGGAVRMNVIDPPVLPSHSDGIGWWAVVIGSLSGLALAVLYSLIGGFGDWQKKEWGHRQAAPLR